MKHISVFLTIFYFAFFQTINAQVAKNSLICQYKFDKNGEDASIYKNTAAIIGNIIPAENRFGIECAAYKFDGRSGYIRVQNSKALEKIKDELTITVWAKLTGNNSLFTICCKSDVANEDFNSPHYRFQISNKQYSLNAYFTEGWNQSFKKNKWYFLAMTVSKTKLKIYIDGKIALNKTLDDKLETNTKDLLIGRDMPGSDEYFKGEMDDFRLYNKTLSASEIGQIFANKSERSMKSPCAKPVVIQDTIRVVINDTVRNVINDTKRQTVVVTDTVRRQHVINDTVRNVINDTKRQTVVVRDTVRRNYVIRDTIRKQVVVTDTIHKQIDATVVTPKKIAGTTVKYQHNIDVYNDNIKMTLFDDKVEDGDTISLNVNGKWVKRKYRIKNRNRVNKNDIIFCKLRKGGNNYIISKAWNLGTIPDNTLAIEIDDQVGNVVKIILHSKIGTSGAVKINYKEK